MASRIIKIVGAGIIYGLIMTFLKFQYNINDQDFYKLFTIVSAVLIIGSVVIYNINMRNFIKKLTQMNYMLNNDEKIDEFIEKHRELLSITKNKYKGAFIRINLSAGLCKINKFEEAKDVLEGMSVKDVSGLNKGIYYLNLTYIYFRLGLYEKALSMMKDSEKYIKALDSKEMLAGNIHILRIWEAIAKGDKKHARNLYKEGFRKYKIAELKDDFDALYEIVEGMR